MRCGRLFQKQYSRRPCNSLRITSPSVQIISTFYWNRSWSSLPSVTTGLPDLWSSDYVSIQCFRWHSQYILPPFLRCTFYNLTSLNVLKPQQAYHKRLPQYYIDSLTTFTSIYMFVVDDGHPLRSIKTVVKKLQNVENVIIRGLQDFLQRIHGFANVRALLSRRETTPGSSATHAQRAGTEIPVRQSFKN